MTCSICSFATGDLSWVSPQYSHRFSARWRTPASAHRSRREKTAGFRLQHRDEFIGLRVTQILRALLIGQLALVRLFGQTLDSLLKRLVAVKINNLQRLLFAENSEDRFGSAVKGSGINGLRHGAESSTVPNRVE